MSEEWYYVDNFVTCPFCGTEHYYKFNKNPRCVYCGAELKPEDIGDI